jgi:Family of unknown function (DUF6510)
MDEVDGNAIGGLLIDVFGTEMTTASSTCGTCGASRPVAELVVYRRAPGTVVRCRTCGSVLMVFVKTHGMTSVDLTGLANLSQPRAALSSGLGSPAAWTTPCSRASPGLPARARWPSYADRLLSLDSGWAARCARHYLSSRVKTERFGGT